MTITKSTTTTIPYTKPEAKGFAQSSKYSPLVQFLFPLPLKATSYHSNEQLNQRHAVLIELNKHDDLWSVASNYRKCHHPDFFGFAVCEEHPLAQAHPRPHSCGETIICEECAKKHHRFEAGRWTNAISQHMVHTPTYLKPHHITFTTDYQLGTGMDNEHVADMMKNVSLCLRKYFLSLSKVARFETSKIDFRKGQCSSRVLTSRLNALRGDERAKTLWYDLRRAKNPRWWQRMRNKLSHGKTLKQLNIGGLFSCEFGEKGNRLHAHMYYHGSPLNWDVMRLIWNDITGFIFVKIQKIDSHIGGVQEVTKYATKLTTCPVECIPALYRAFKGQRRIRAIGSFHGLIAEYDEKPEPLSCKVCGGYLTLMSEFEYSHLIFLITGDKSSNGRGVKKREHPPPLLNQLPLI